MTIFSTSCFFGNLKLILFSHSNFVIVLIYYTTLKVNKYIVGRGLLTLLFLKTSPLYYLPTLFQNFSQLDSLCFLVYLTEGAIAPHLMCYFLINDIMDLYMSSLGTLVPQRLCGMFYATMRQFTEV